MNRLFRFWMTASAFWILFALILGGHRWQFPAAFDVCWQRQKAVFSKSLRVPKGVKNKVSADTVDAMN